MKKLLALVLAFALVLSLGAVAFAAPSPSADVSSDSLPAQTEAEPVVAAPAEEAAKVISNEDMTEEQKEAVDAAIEDVVAEGYLPVDDFIVEADEPATIVIKAPEAAVVFVIYPDGTVVEFAVEDLVKLSDGTYELPVDGDCIVIVATKA